MIGKWAKYWTLWDTMSDIESYINEGSKRMCLSVRGNNKLSCGNSLASLRAFGVDMDGISEVNYSFSFSAPSGTVLNKSCRRDSSQ